MSQKSEEIIRKKLNLPQADAEEEEEEDEEEEDEEDEEEPTADKEDKAVEATEGAAAAGSRVKHRTSHTLLLVLPRILNLYCFTVL